MNFFWFISMLGVVLVIGVIIGFGFGFATKILQLLDIKKRGSRFMDTAVFFLLGACICLIIAIASTTFSAYFLINSKAVTATVIKTIEKEDKNGDIWHYPVYEYYLSNGTRYEDRSDKGGGRKYQKGDEIVIRYLKKSPHESRVDNFAQHWGVPLFFAIASVVLFCLSYYFKRVRAGQEGF